MPKTNHSSSLRQESPLPTPEPRPTNAVSLTVPGQIEYRELATRLVASACKLASRGRTLEERFSHELVSAVGEAFNNAVFHAYQSTSGRITLQVEADKTGIEIRLEEDGATFEPNDVPDPDLSEPQESGMGLFIIRAFVDRVSYVPGPPNSLRMRKNYP